MLPADLISYSTINVIQVINGVGELQRILTILSYIYLIIGLFIVAEALHSF